jgi:hypothetical protein
MSRPGLALSLVSRTRYQAAKGTKQILELDVGHEFARAHKQAAITVTWDVVECGKAVQSPSQQYHGQSQA